MNRENRTLFLTADEVCDFLKISKKTLWNWVYLKQLRYFKLNNRLLRFRKADVEKMIVSKDEDFNHSEEIEDNGECTKTN